MQWLNRYKKLIKKFKTIETHEHKYVFYKIKNLKKFNNALEIDTIIAKEKNTTAQKKNLKTYYANTIKYHNKHIRINLFLRYADDKILKKINTDHLPLFQKTYSVYKVVNKLKFKELIANYGR